MSTQTRPAPRTKDRRPLAVLIDEATEHLADLGYFVLFVIDLQTRRVQIGGVVRQPYACG